MPVSFVNNGNGARTSGEGVTSPAVEAVVDAATLCLTSYDSLRKVVDARKLRAALAPEVVRVTESDSPIALTPLFIYMFSAAKPWFATNDVMACVREIATAIEERGFAVRLPDAFRQPTRQGAASARTRGPIGTRVGGSAVPRPTRKH